MFPYHSHRRIDICGLKPKPEEGVRDGGDDLRKGVMVERERWIERERDRERNRENERRQRIDIEMS